MSGRVEGGFDEEACNLVRSYRRDNKLLTKEGMKEKCDEGDAVAAYLDDSHGSEPIPGGPTDPKNKPREVVKGIRDQWE